MALTGITTSSDQKKKLWEEKLFREQLIQSYFSKFMSESPESIIQTKTALEKSKGDEIEFTLIPRLTGSGVTTGETLEGKEEKMTPYNFDVVLERYRHGIRFDYISDKRAFFSISDEGAFHLRNWGTEKIDKLIFNALKDSHTRVFYTTDGSTPATTATAATAKGALTTSSLIFPKLISYAKTWALTGGNRSQSPLRPIMVNGKPYIVLLVHPDVKYDLSQDSVWQQANREAQARGNENPIFSGADAIWDGVVVHSHESVPIGTDAGAGANVPWAQNFVLGAQAAVWAWGQRPSVITKEFDYEEETGIAWRMTAGVERAKFNSKDFGLLGFYTGRTQISDAT